MSGPATSGSGRSLPDALFPLVRHLSIRATPILARTALTPNQVTVLAILSGLAAASAIIHPGHGWALAAGLLLVVSYVLDNCDGEIATLKNMRSTLGAKLDTFGDWLVHAGFFAALGIGMKQATGEPIWAWLGWIAAAGGTINYLLGLWLDRKRGPASAASPGAEERNDRPETVRDWLVYIFRELFRADFCFIVLLLAVFDAVWLLLPLAAVGAQVYWFGLLFAGGKTYHV